MASELATTYPVLVLLPIDGDFFISSRTIAEGVDLQHASVLRVIDDHRTDFEQFGQLRFEIEPGYNNASVRSALLNEQQATLLMTYQRNSNQVRLFKIALVKAFYEMAHRSPQPETPEQAMARAVIVAQGIIERRDQQIAELTPRAEAWDELASAEGDYAVGDAAKMLARAGIPIGPQKLFEHLGQIGWLFRDASRTWKPYARVVQAGYLTERPQSHRHPRTDAIIVDAPQVRVTIRGLNRLRQTMATLKQVTA